MKKIKLFIILIPIFLFSIERPLVNRPTPSLKKDFAFTKPQHSYWYVSGGCVYLIPKINLGYRFQKNLSGGDFFLEAGTLGSKLSFGGIGYNQHLYFYPGEKFQPYLGLGLGLGVGSYIGITDTRPMPFFSINTLAGLQFKSKNHYHIIEARVTTTSMYFWRELIFLPLPSISYGVSF